MNEKLFRIQPTNEEQTDFVIIVGNHLATEEHFKTRIEALAYASTPKWDMILALVAEMFEIHETYKHSNKQIKEDAKKVVENIINNTINKEK